MLEGVKGRPPFRRIISYAAVIGLLLNLVGSLMEMPAVYFVGVPLVLFSAIGILATSTREELKWRLFVLVIGTLIIIAIIMLLRRNGN